MALYLAVFLGEFVLLVAAGLPLSIAETSHPAFIHSRAVAIWQEYHMFFHHQGEWLPVLVLAAGAVGGWAGIARLRQE